MKIISNNECYIEKSDIDYLIRNYNDIPNDIFKNANDEEDFVKIEGESSIDFIINSSIPSFEELSKLDINNLKRKMFKIRISMLDDYESKNLSDEELKIAIKEEKNRKYLLEQIIKIIKYKRGIFDLKYPDIPNPTKEYISNGKLNAAMSMNFGNLIIYNVDGSRVDDIDDIKFCEIAYKMLMNEYIDIDNMELEKNFDGNYLIIKNKTKQMEKILKRFV